MAKAAAQAALRKQPMQAAATITVTAMEAATHTKRLSLALDRAGHLDRYTAT